VTPVNLEQAQTLAFAYTYFRGLAKTGNPVEALWAEYFWRSAKSALEANNYRLVWNRSTKRHEAALHPKNGTKA